MPVDDPRMDEFRREDGGIDWSAYNAAQVRVGLKCRTCNAYAVIFGKCPGHPQDCVSCEKARKSPAEELRHDRFVRCPGCRHLFEVSEYDPRDEDEDTCCPQCDREFTAKMEVSVTWVSPAADPEQVEADDQPDDDAGESEDEPREDASDGQSSPQAR
jgi:uncharacterized CHY-type Zn-finger protein